MDCGVSEWDKTVQHLQISGALAPIDSTDVDCTEGLAYHFERDPARDSRSLHELHGQRSPRNSSHRIASLCEGKCASFLDLIWAHAGDE